MTNKNKKNSFDGRIIYERDILFSQHVYTYKIIGKYGVLIITDKIDREKADKIAVKKIEEKITRVLVANIKKIKIEDI